MSTGALVLTVIGARPQFVKAAVMSEALRVRGWREYLIHTGQHYDDAMSRVFFTELGIPEPDVNLGIGSGLHGEATGRMMAGIEAECLRVKPGLVLVYGDTNSTLAAGLVASKLNIPVVHVEAGLRSFDRRMPEEVNRILVDHISSLLFCPSKLAVMQLAAEGIFEGVHEVGDIMLDALNYFLQKAREKECPLSRWELEPQEYALLTIHRPSNTDDPNVFERLIQVANEIGPVLFPVHPRCRKRVESLVDRGVMGENIKVTDPLSYLDLLSVARQARFIATDSGGLQKEAYWLKVPCITLREQTEWVETVESGWNRIVGNSAPAFRDAARNIDRSMYHPELYGDGTAAAKICEILANWVPGKKG